jgi:hypothetical protein
MRRTMAIMELLAVVSLYPSMFLLVSCVVSCDVLSLILPPHVAYRLRALIGRIRILGQGS